MLTAKKVVLLSGPGGAASSTYAISSYIRAKRLATFVSGFCANACAYIWLAGSPRFMAPNASIGFHSASDGNGRDSNTGNAVLGAYMNELGLSVNAIAWATTAGPDDIAYLRPQTARQLGIDITVSPDLQSVALALESRSGR